MVGVLIGARLTVDAVGYYGPVLASVAAFLVCAAGNVVNDIVDRPSDRINHQNRALVRGRLSVRYAAILAVVLNLTALVFAASVDVAVTITVAAAIAMLAGYNFLLKRIPVLGNLTVAALSGLTFVTGGLASGSAGAFALPGPLIPAAFAVIIHLMRELIKDIEDIEGDRRSSVKTLPQLIGVRSTLYLVVTLSLALVVLTLLPVIKGWFGLWYELIVIYLIDLPLAAVFILVLAAESPKRLRICSAALKAGMVLGIVALFLA
jgi:geranylgeranylglycerol-phosphate geranylgeranyltransferase